MLLKFPWNTFLRIVSVFWSCCQCWHCFYSSKEIVLNWTRLRPWVVCLMSKHIDSEGGLGNETRERVLKSVFVFVSPRRRRTPSLWPTWAWYCRSTLAGELAWAKSGLSTQSGATAAPLSLRSWLPLDVALFVPTRWVLKGIPNTSSPTCLFLTCVTGTGSIEY